MPRRQHARGAGAGLLQPARATRARALAARLGNHRRARCAQLQPKLRLADLLEEAQRQGEELQTQQEELRVANEELQQQGDVLRSADAQLEEGREEPGASNAEFVHAAGRARTAQRALCPKR